MNDIDIELLKGIQKNAKMGMTAIETIHNKVYDDALGLQLSRQEMIYEDIHNRASYKLKSAKAEPYSSNKISDMMLKGGIHMNTMFDCSNSHIAEMMIKGNNMGVTDMWKNMNQYKGAQKDCVELAKELTDFEERCIQQFRNYL